MDLQECRDKLNLKKKETLPRKETRYERTLSNECCLSNFAQISKDKEKLDQNSVSTATFTPDLENRFIDYLSYKI